MTSRPSVLAAAAAAFMTLALQGRADAAETVYDFSLSGTYNGAPVSVSGDFSIDTSEGASVGAYYYGNFAFQSLNVAVSGFPQFTPNLDPRSTAFQQTTFGTIGRASTVFVQGTEINSPFLSESLEIDLAPTFTDVAIINVGDDVIASEIQARLQPRGPVATALLTGTLTAVPEPAAWIDMIAGAALVGGLARRRRAVSPAAA